MTKSRLEAFSDGVVAILITIMVLELKAPAGAEWSDLGQVIPAGLAYTLSFVMLGIYWNNHHHMLHAAHRVNGAILWANLHLLFWLSLIPFLTMWMGEHPFASAPTFAYAMDLALASVAYLILARCIVALEGPDSVLAKAMGRDRKGKLSVALNALALPAAVYVPRVAVAIFILVGLIWLVPDTRVERTLSTERH